MTTLKDVKKLAKTLGAIVTVERHGNTITLGVEAPSGCIWAASDVHELVDCVYAGWPNDYEDVLARMAYGIQPCPYVNNGCDWCDGEE